jgi:hypothetical protein
MRISGREKLFLWGGAVSLAALLVFLLAVDPALKRAGELKRLIPQKEQELKQLRLLQKELESLRETKAALLQKIPAGERTLPPLSRLDGWIERSGLRPSVKSIKPSPSPGGDGMAVDVLMEPHPFPLRGPILLRRVPRGPCQYKAPVHHAQISGRLPAADLLPGLRERL